MVVGWDEIEHSTGEPHQLVWQLAATDTTVIRKASRYVARSQSGKSSDLPHPCHGVA